MDEYKHLFREYLAYFTKHDGKKGPRGKDDDVFIIMYGTGEFDVLCKEDTQWEDGDVEDFSNQPNPFMDYMQLKIIAYCNITKFLKEDSYELKEEYTKENARKTCESLYPTFPW
jgi:hypothetical protein